MEWMSLIPPLLLFLIRIADYFLDERKNREKTLIEKQVSFDSALASGNIGVLNRDIDDANLLLLRLLGKASTYSPR